MSSHLLDWPGKSARDGGPEHPALYHMLDVAAVAEQLLRPSPLPAEWKAAFVLLIALHDLGKIGAGFRAMIREGKPQAARHWELTEAWLLGDEVLENRLAVALPQIVTELFPACAGMNRAPVLLVGGLGLFPARAGMNQGVHISSWNFLYGCSLRKRRDVIPITPQAMYSR
ncbi:CRISPR-associated endonuclease Cas3'' [Paracoccus luteus]|uniref:CRISPR-associated endonuclease Cas3'' n=1 Tax=Paracoccus luteus TaxID=2508543 RepID=UPI001FE55B05|nr:CRISPR-associated endonuclease Cas3'' [Paracoccus luteus]